MPQPDLSCDRNGSAYAGASEARVMASVNSEITLRNVCLQLLIVNGQAQLPSTYSHPTQTTTGIGREAGGNAGSTRYQSTTDPSSVS